ncbi:cell death protein 3-like [Acropora muricata]|uniref:cell death protein 3-like n=1 Tax=Acropora muricata TaxID=159855 RepID=UPI0034E54799
MGDPPWSDADVKRLAKLFKGIGYNVRVQRDPLSARDFETQLKDLLANHAFGDSVIVAVLAHGSNEACRGSRLSHVKLPLHEAKEGMSTISRDPVENDAASLDARQDEEREDSDSLPIGIPAHSHVLIYYATLPGFVSHRNLRKGSWYIQSLVEVFSQYAFEEDVLSLLTFVNYNVSRKFKTMRDFRQIPAPQSTLTKKLFFLPGYFEDDDHSSAASTST